MIVPYFPKELTDEELAFFQGQIDYILENKADKTYVTDIVDGTLKPYIEATDKKIADLKLNLDTFKTTTTTNFTTTNSNVTSVLNALNEFKTLTTNNVTTTNGNVTAVNNALASHISVFNAYKTSVDAQLLALGNASSIIFSASAPANTRALWINSTGIANAFNGSSWVPIGAVWK